MKGVGAETRAVVLQVIDVHVPLRARSFPTTAVQRWSAPSYAGGKRISVYDLDVVGVLLLFIAVVIEYFAE